MTTLWVVVRSNTVMRRWNVHRLLGAALVITVAAAGAGGQSRATAAPLPARRQSLPLQDVALGLSDVPAGFTETAASFHKLSQSARADGVSIATLKGHGWMSSYESTFQRSALAGLIDIDDDVVIFHSSAGAGWLLQRIIGRAHQTFHGHHFLPMSVGRLGDKAVGYSYRETVKGIDLTVVAVMFRRGGYAAEVLAAGVTGTFDPAEPAHLAQTIDRRIAKG